MDVTVFAGTDERGQAGPARVFDSPGAPADPDALSRLNRATALADLAAAPVVLPDFHHKHDLEMPSSIAVATPGDHPARVHQRLGELRDGPARPGRRRPG